MGRLPNATQPRLDAMFRLGERIWEEREDVRRTFGDIRSFDFWYWLLLHGPEEIPELAEGSYPLPPRQLVDRVVGHVDLRGYVVSGLVDARRVYRCLRETDFDFEGGGEVLDFGCGSGRIIRHFARYASHCRFEGVDVDREAIRWCAEHLDFARFSPIPHDPPTDFESERFDALYSYSVFSHLPEQRHLRWLDEFTRITRPGAIVIATVMGRACVDGFLGGSQSGHPGRRRMRKGVPVLDRTGFLFIPYRRLRLRSRSNRNHFRAWDLEQYGSTFVLEPYIRRHWLDRFDLVAFHESPDGWQDYVVLRRK